MEKRRNKRVYAGFYSAYDGRLIYVVMVIKALYYHILCKFGRLFEVRLFQFIWGKKREKRRQQIQEPQYQICLPGMRRHYPRHARGKCNMRGLWGSF